MKFLLLYLLIVNAAAFLLMHADKQKAKKNLWRIPEVVLLGTCLFGGALGGYIGMINCHHKTRKPFFRIGIPVMLALQILLIILIVK